MNNALPGTLLAVRDGRQGGTVCLVLQTDGGENERLTLSRADYERLGEPPVGLCLDGETLAGARDAAARRNATVCALRILEHADSNRRTLMRKLLARNIPRSCAEAAVEEMIRLGFLDEARTARRQIALCAQKGWGRRKIYAYLVSHGFPGSLCEEEIRRAEADGEVDFAGARRNLILKCRTRGMEDDEIRRALWRAGF